jgi:hypothetical protein
LHEPRATTTPTPQPVAQPAPAPAQAPTPNPTPGEVSHADPVDVWPLTIDTGRLARHPTKHVTFTGNGKTYAVNGTAKSAAAEKRWEKNIDEIWADDPALNHGLRNTSAANRSQPCALLLEAPPRRAAEERKQW